MTVTPNGTDADRTASSCADRAGGRRWPAAMNPSPPARTAATTKTGVNAPAAGGVCSVRDVGRRVPEDVLVVTRYDGVLGQ